jgi:hypothetical protein
MSSYCVDNQTNHETREKGAKEKERIYLLAFFGVFSGHSILPAVFFGSRDEHSMFDVRGSALDVHLP